MPFSTPILTFRSLLTGLGLALTVASARAQAPATGAAAPTSRYPHTAVGITLGYGSPYGCGVDFSFMVQPQLDVNVGLGASITGGKIGVGTRYYFTPQRKVSAFVGGNLAYSTGLNNVTINTGGQTTTYGGYSSYSSSSSDKVIVNFKSTALLHLRGGVRWQPVRRFALLGALGYGIVLGGDPVQYVGGDYSSQTNRNWVNFFSPGGLELSVGVAFPLGQGN